MYVDWAKKRIVGFERAGTCNYLYFGKGLIATNMCSLQFVPALNERQFNIALLPPSYPHLHDFVCGN